MNRKEIKILSTFIFWLKSLQANRHIYFLAPFNCGF